MGVFSRRNLILLSMLGAGLTSCLQRFKSSKIKTDLEGIIGQKVNIETQDGLLPAYYALPANGEEFPVVLVIHEIFGVNDYIEDICRRLGKLGYLAIAPHLFFRLKNFAQLQDIKEIASAVLENTSDAQVFGDLDTTLTWVKNSGKGKMNQLGITGFCWGGRMVWLYAHHNPNVKAGVAWYGNIIGKSNALTPKQPINIAPELQVPILGLYGGKDQLIPQETVKQMQQVLQTSKRDSEIIIYPEASHGFFADYRPSYQKQAALDGWQRLQNWMRRIEN